MWKIITTKRFDKWYRKQTDRLQDEILSALIVLRQKGPATGRPLVDTLKASNYPNMKELRISFDGRPIRALFAFDPARQAIFLCAGDKTGDKKFYKSLINIADAEYKAHLAALEKQ